MRHHQSAEPDHRGELDRREPDHRGEPGHRGEPNHRGEPQVRSFTSQAPASDTQEHKVPLELTRGEPRPGRRGGEPVGRDGEPLRGRGEPTRVSPPTYSSSSSVLPQSVHSVSASGVHSSSTHGAPRPLGDSGGERSDMRSVAQDTQSGAGRRREPSRDSPHAAYTPSPRGNGSGGPLLRPVCPPPSELERRLTIVFNTYQLSNQAELIAK